ncbi:DUF6602 domain-containing protein [Pseudobacillus badius]|uniref:DUF6602 domain-containing protein n=1 Tax=Bacillus badius TaxID=1455 RepID=UPI0007B07C97|nr:DUF6602 domain-containing protein [Bacillus badius]KZN99851.1 hypothetical protein A4244_17835 [Bacillus badius]OCS85955.1 hypothetical protein A6M11_17850 [Bacillus badius]OVE51685.1 hypothetical protein B1A98_08970 [Bacillus badius]TDW03099.1 hypothetical protein B0G66_1041 [Bacillus badius]
MIVTVADFLNSLMKKEKELIKQYEIVDHGPTIGDMYEGLTSSLLDKALFKELDIRVASGKIRNKEGEFSNEVDCMIVEGEGDPIPYTNKFIYDISNVIAVLEIKKNLYKDDLIDSYNKMHQIYKISSHQLTSIRGLRDAFRHIVKKELPDYKDVDLLPFHEQMIYHTLLIEEILPSRIIFGYYGYKSEFSLREAFVNFLNDQSGKKGFSPVIFPDLVVCGNYSLAKLDGMPYIGFMDKNDFWNFYGSSNDNPLLLLLEIIWTKLSYKYSINSSIFGEDLEFEAFHMYLAGKAKEDGEKMGWEFKYHFMEKEELRQLDPIRFEWEPAELDEQEFVIINWLCINGALNINELGLREWMLKEEKDLEKTVNYLKEKNLVSFENGNLTLLTDQCQVVAVDGKWYAAENKSGRLTNWLKKRMKAKKQA